MRFPGFFYKWEITELTGLGEFLGGGTPSSSNDDFWKGNVPWISSSDLSENNIHSVNVSRFITEEAINNSAKYSNASHVQIDIYYNTGSFSFKVKDNGVGFIEGAIEKGNGLENMRARANEIKAELSISSELNKGVEITVSIKLK